MNTHVYTTHVSLSPERQIENENILPERELHGAVST